MLQKNTIKDWIKNSVTLKLFFIGFLVLILLIPTLMVRGLVSERNYRANMAKNEISEKWGKEQTITGPVLTIPYQIRSRDKWNRIIATSSVRHAYFLPDKLDIDGEIIPEVRSRTIFDAILYTADLKLSGYFEPSFADIDPRDILWENAYLSVGIPDMRGLKEVPSIKWNEASYELAAGSTDAKVFSSGLGARLSGLAAGEKYDFSLNLKVNGSEQINFTPMGKTTDVSLKSTWSSPSFNGAFLPTDHEITDEGFSANWKILDLNRNFPQTWDNQTHSTYESEFGLKLIMPVDTYQQTTRSVKYAVLFILLTFLTYFLVEVLKKVKVHPIQYLLVGFAIVLFYLLLLSLSEHLDFDTAYIIASVGIISMISLYSGAILKKRAFGFILAAILIALYIYLYVLLQLQDYSLLMGSLGLFLTLAIVMYLTRKVDWYKISSQE